MPTDERADDTRESDLPDATPPPEIGDPGPATDRGAASPDAGGTTADADATDADSPGAKYYRSTGPLSRIVYIQEPDHWYSYADGTLLREGEGQIPEHIFDYLEETDQSHAEEAYESSRRVREYLHTLDGPSEDEGVSGPVGVGGWMVPPIILLILTPIVYLVVLFIMELPVFRRIEWSELPVALASLSIFDLFASVVMIVAPIALLVCVAKRRPSTPNLIIGFAFFYLLVRVIDTSIVVGVLLGPLRDTGFTEGAREVTSTGLVGLAIAVVLAVAWIPYFSFSKRVKNTFRTESAAAPRRARRRVAAWVFGTGMAAAVALLVLLSWGYTTLSREIDSFTTRHGDLTTYTDPDYGYSFDYPSDWVMQRSITVEEGTIAVPGAVTVYGPSRAGTYSTDAITVVAQSAPAPDPAMLPLIKSQLEASLDTVLDSSLRATIVEPLTETTVGGLTGYTVTLADSVEGLRVTATLYWLFDEHVQYQLMTQCTTADLRTVEDSFADFLASFTPGPD